MKYKVGDIIKLKNYMYICKIVGYTRHSRAYALEVLIDKINYEMEPILFPLYIQSDIDKRFDLMPGTFDYKLVETLYG